MVDIENLYQWTTENNMLVRTFIFDDFVQAVNFVNKIVPLAEEVRHHPDIEIYSYKKVKVKLYSHEEGGVTQKDVDLAFEIDKLVK